MLRSLRTQNSTAAATLFTILLFLSAQALGAMGAGRLMPNGQVKVYRGDELISVLSEEAPLPEGVLLAPEGPCGLRMDNLYVVADDGSRFSIAGGEGGRELMIREGTLYFAMSGATGPLAFHTPDGVVTTQRMILGAATGGGLLKGYVDASPDGTRMGVLEGGSLVVMTADGERTIESGKQITLAQANLFDEEQAPGGAGATSEDQEDTLEDVQDDDDDDIPAAYFWGGGALLAGIGAAAAFGGSGGGGGGGGGHTAGQPFQPVIRTKFNEMTDGDLQATAGRRFDVIGQ